MASIMTPMISLQLINKPKLTTPLSWRRCAPKRCRMAVVSASSEPQRKLAEEMKMAAMKLHEFTPARERGKEATGLAITQWEPTLEGYLMFLADSKLVYQALDRILHKDVFPEYAEFRNTGLERSDRLARDMEWLEKQGHAIPPPSSAGVNYARYLNELSEKDPHALSFILQYAFICHFYMTYFGHTAGGRIIGKKVEEKLLHGKELEFYKYDGDLPQLLQNVREKLNEVGERWSREEKDRCLHEFENSFSLGGDVLRLVLFSST